MLHFECDYTEGAHPAVIEKICSTNMEQTCGYANDRYCETGIVRKQGRL